MQNTEFKMSYQISRSVGSMSCSQYYYRTGEEKIPSRKSLDEFSDNNLSKIYESKFQEEVKKHLDKTRTLIGRRKTRRIEKAERIAIILEDKGIL